MNGPVAECHAEECTEGDRRCFESDGLPDSDIEYCLNGSWVLSQSCQSNKPEGGSTCRATRHVEARVRISAILMY